MLVEVTASASASRVGTLETIVVNAACKSRSTMQNMKQDYENRKHNTTQITKLLGSMNESIDRDNEPDRSRNKAISMKLSINFFLIFYICFVEFDYQVHHELHSIM